MVGLELKASSARRIEGSSTLRISRIGVAKEREDVAIGRNGIVNGELSFKIVNNRGDRDVRRRSSREMTIGYDACTSNSECMDKSEIFSTGQCYRTSPHP
jgi:hypothetical protein